MPGLDVAESRRRFAAARVARLATVRADGRPHLVPIVFAMDGDTVYSIADPKPKKGLDLLRHRNITVNPDVSVLVDVYDEGWERLWWVRADGTARIATAGADREAAIHLLREKYTQYGSWTTPFGAATVIHVTRWAGWELARQ